MWSKYTLTAAEPEFPQPKAGNFSEMRKKILAAVLFCVEEKQRGHCSALCSHLSSLGTLSSFLNIL